MQKVPHSFYWFKRDFFDNPPSLPHRIDLSSIPHRISLFSHRSLHRVGPFILSLIAPSHIAISSTKVFPLLLLPICDCDFWACHFPFALFKEKWGFFSIKRGKFDFIGLTGFSPAKMLEGKRHSIKAVR